MLLIAGSIAAAERGPILTEVDTRPALSAGSYTVSRYLAWKYFDRHVASLPAREIPASDRGAWIERFRAEQVVIARAMQLGYAERPDVLDVVQRVERTILTQRSGPYYRRLFETKPASEEHLREIFRHQYIVAKGWIARFPSAELATTILGEDFARCTLQEQTRRIEACASNDRVAMRSGMFTWPYSPFIEIGEFLVTHPKGRTLEHRDQSGWIYWIHLDPIQEMPNGDFFVERERFATTVQRFSEEAMIERTRLRILREKSPRIEPTAELLLGRLRVAGNEANLISADLVADLGKKVLFTYPGDMGVETMTVSSFCSWNNQRFIRRIPRSFPQLREDIETFVIDETVHREAIKTGLDRTAQFLEDRRGFLGYQVLETYKKEVLLPNVTVSADDIRRYYDDHRSEFRRATRRLGRLLMFPTSEAAFAWKNSSGANAKPSGAAPEPVTERTVSVSQNSGVAGLSVPAAALLNAPPGSVYGPFSSEGKPALFVCGQAEMADEALIVVEPTIRQIVQRDALHREVERLGRELARSIEFQDNLESCIPKSRNPEDK